MDLIRLQIVCDHPVLADALTERLAREPDPWVVHQHRSVDPHLVEAVRAHRPTVTVVDARSVSGPWPALVDELVEAAPQTRVAVLAASADPEDTMVAAHRCLAAWLPPDVTAARVVDALRDVAAGLTVYPPDLLGAVLRRFADELRDRPVTVGPLALLTDREHEVLAQLAEGRRDHEIAEHLDMATTTVRTHTGRILRKLHVHSRLEAIRLARRHGVAPAAPRRLSTVPGRQSEYPA